MYYQPDDAPVLLGGALLRMQRLSRISERIVMLKIPDGGASRRKIKSYN